MMRRRFLLLCWPLPLMAQTRALPLRNLLVELRLVDSRHAASGSLGGDVTVGTSGVQAGVTAEARERTRDIQASQQLRVLNGGRASVRLAQALPLQWIDLAATARVGAVIIRQAWAEAVSGFEVRPRWAGEGPVTVEIVALAPHETLVTELSVPLGEWTTVAQSVRDAANRERGVLSTRDVDRSATRSLQLRVTVD